MRIHAVTLSNFRSYQMARFDGFDSYNFIAGMNGAGKSSVLDAISLALTGECPAAERGRGTDELRHVGSASPWEILLEFATAPGQPVRQIRRREGEGPRSAAQEYVDSLLGLPPARVRACLYSGAMFSMSPKEAQRLILDLADDAIPLSDQIREALVRQLRHTLPERVNLSDIEGLHKEVYEARRVAGQVVRAGEAVLPAPPVGMEMLTGQTEEQVAANLKTIETRLEALRKERKVSPVDEKQLTVAKRRGALEVAERDRAKALAAYQAEPEGIAARLDLLLSQEAEEEQRVSEIAARKKQATEGISTELANHRILTGRIESLEGLPEVCPTCQSKISQTKMQKLIGDLGRQRDAAKAEIDRLDALVKSLTTNRVDYSLQIRQARGQVERRDLAATTLRDRDAEVQDAKARLAQAESALKQAQDEAPDAEQQKALEARIAEGERRQGLVSQYLGALRAFSQANRGQEQARNTHSELDWLVKELGPGGIRQGLGEGLAEFQAALNGHLRAMGYEVDLGPLLRLEDDARVNGLRARVLSHSQKDRFGIAWQIALAKWSGLGIVVVDEWERFDVPWGARIREELRGSGCQVFVLAVLKDAVDRYRQSGATAPATMACYLVEQAAEDGASRVERIERLQKEAS